MTPSPDAQEILSAIRSAARDLGRAPTRSEFARLSGISHFKVLARFSSLREAVLEAGLEPNPQGLRIASAALLEDWAMVARRLSKVPSRSQYLRHGRYSAGVFTLRFRSWTATPGNFRRFALENGLEETWSDVLRLIADAGFARDAAADASCDAGAPAPLPSGPAANAPEPRAFLRGRAVLGAPLSLPGLAYEPANETGVVFLFGMLAHRLGFRVESLQAAFPDCEAARQIQPGKWQRVRIEFEYESRNFLTHRHPAGECDVIVCWRHNWPECPENLDVVELRKIVRRHELG